MSGEVQQVVPQERQVDDGVRFQCSECEAYVKRAFDGGNAIRCGECRKLFTFCDDHMPDLSRYGEGAVWLCEECR